MTRRFTFRDDWVVDAPPAQVQSVLVDLEHYPDWWPQVLAVAKVDDDHARVLCRSTLPYTLDLLLTAVHREQALLETTVEGDLVGVVRWRLTPAVGGTRLAFEQEVVVAHGLLSTLAGPLAPVLRWNHHRMMAGCLTGLRTRLR